METRYSPNNLGYRELGTKELRTTFLVESLFAPEKLALVYSDVDRAIIGSAVPVASPLQPTADAELRAAYFCERRVGRRRRSTGRATPRARRSR